MGIADTIEGIFSDKPQSSSLKGFLSKFNSASAPYVDQIDPLQTFDVKLAFFPTLWNPMLTKRAGKGTKLKQGLASAASNLLDNITGGLMSANSNDVNVLDMRNKFLCTGYFGNTTFLDYVARANSLVGGGADADVAQPQLILDLSYYVQNASLPQLTMPTTGNVDTSIGSFPINGTLVKPSQNTFTLTVINTKAPLMERVFYPWMREITMPFWAYNTQPYTTANITISFDKHTDLQYIFVGSRPSNIETIHPSNEASGIPTRSVTFLFDHMFVKSKLSTAESVSDKLKNIASSAVNDIGKSFGF